MDPTAPIPLDNQLIEGLAKSRPTFANLPGTLWQARIFWVTLEGPIGAGKTELFKVLSPKLEEHFGKDRIFFVPEPIDELMSSGLFQEYQHDPKRWAFEFQTTFFHKRTLYFREAYDRMLKKLASTSVPQDEQSVKTAIVLSERSIVSDTCFMRVQYECGHVNEDSLHRYLDLNAMWRELYRGIAPNLIVYCRAGTDTASIVDLCQQRIRERKREAEEDLVTPEYNGLVLREHDRLFLQPGSVFVVKGFVGGGPFQDPLAIPVVVVDTTENYRDDSRLALKKSSELLNHIKASLPPLEVAKVSYLPPPEHPAWNDVVVVRRVDTTDCQTATGLE